MTNLIGSAISRNYLRKSLLSLIEAIQRVRHLVPQVTSYQIYRFLTQKLFDYCNYTVWGNYGITLKNKSQEVQNRAARVLTFSNYDAHAGYLFELRLTSITFKELRWFASLYMSCPQTIYVLDFKKAETAYSLRDSRNKLNVRLLRTITNSFTAT